ncbi:MAG: hypothetical protein R6U10_02800 [Thermoplasmatota archaeon]
MTDAGIEMGTVANIADLAAVQDGAVVSRTVLDRETGSVTLFAFDGSRILGWLTTRTRNSPGICRQY